MFNKQTSIVIDHPNSKMTLRGLKLLGLSLMALPSMVYAEGSRDLYPSNTADNVNKPQAKRSYLMARGGHSSAASAAAFDPYPNSGVMRVYAKAGETIYAGSSIAGMGASNSGGNSPKGDIVMVSPNGQVYRLSTTDATNFSGSRNARKGLIRNRSQELAGPAVAGVAGGYIPFSQVVGASQAGVWEIHFIAIGNGGTNIPGAGQHAKYPNNNLTFDGLQIPSSENFNYEAHASAWYQPVFSGNNSTTFTSLILAWDVSVGAAANANSLIPGRLFTNTLNLTGPNSVFNERSFYHTFTVLTPSGFSYDVNTNGLNGASFNFFSNNKGVRKSSNVDSSSAYSSFSYNSSASHAESYINSLHSKVWDPRRPDALIGGQFGNFTNKIFYNSPSADLPTGNVPAYYTDPASTTPFGTSTANSTGDFGAKSTWLRNTYIAPSLENVRIDCAGNISFKANKVTRYRMLFDCNYNGTTPSFDENVDRIIEEEVPASLLVNYIWNRKNGLGNNVPNSQQVYVRIELLEAGSEVHFPLIDVETNARGIKISLNENITAADNSVIYYNDNGLTGNNNTTPSPLVAKNTGVSSANGAHSWSSTDNTEGTSFGNNRLIDTWTYVKDEVLIAYQGLLCNPVSISGQVWNDGNGDGNIGNNEVAGNLGNEVAVYLIDTVSVPGQQIVIGKTYLNANGTYNFTNVAPNATYQVVLSGDTTILAGSSNNQFAPIPDEYVNTVDKFGANNNLGNGREGGTPNGQIWVNVTANNPVDGVDFGIQKAPIADAKQYLDLPHNVFGNTSSVPALSTITALDGYTFIQMNNSAIGGLSGSDAEDCPSPGSCNSNSTFIIDSIYPTTKLVYDFGGNIGVKEIKITNGVPVTIPNFDPSKMFILAAEGTGSSIEPVGFTYQLQDLAGAVSAPVDYVITTNVPLSTADLSLVAHTTTTHIELVWNGVEEQDVVSYAVLRSGEGKHWKTLVEIPASGVGAVHYKDEQPLKGTNYFKILMTYKNGTEAASSVVKANWKMNGVQVAPNPSSGLVYVKGLSRGNVIKVYDFTGKVQQEFVANATELTCDLSGYTAGYYMILVVDENGNTQSFKTMKK